MSYLETFNDTHVLERLGHIGACNSFITLLRHYNVFSNNFKIKYTAS